MAMMAADTTLPTFRVHTYTARTLAAVAGDTLTYSEVVDSAQFEAPAMPQMAMMAGQMAGSMRGMTTVTKMDSRGRVLAIEVTPAPGAMGGPMGGVMGGPPMAGGPGGGMGGGRGRGGPMGGMFGGRGQRAFFLLPAQPVRPGDTWTDSMTVADSSGGMAIPPATLRATFRLERLERRGGSQIAVISMNGTLTSASPQGQSTMTMNTAGEIQVDLTASRLASLTMESNGTVASPQGEMPMRMRITMQAMM
jgi:hypothetical protein